jgi:hypothetical protein
VEDARFVLQRVRVKGSSKGSPKKRRIEQNVRSRSHDRETKGDVTKGGYPVDGLSATVYRGITAVGSRRVQL